MIIHTYGINYKYGDVIKIKPIGDVHFGNKYCNKRAFKEFLADSDKKTYFLGIGDLMDCIIVSDQKRYQKHADASPTDTPLDYQIDGIYDILKPYANRIIGLGRGNHEDTIIKHCGTDPMKRLCEKLSCNYLGLSGLVRLSLTENKARGRSVIIRWHHGWGGGSRTQGADLTKYSKDTMYWDADIFLYGHVHRKQSDKVPRLGLCGNKLISKPKVIGICGTFLKTYSDTESSTYSELKGYPPVEIGGITVNIKPNFESFVTWIDDK